METAKHASPNDNYYMRNTGEEEEEEGGDRFFSVLQLCWLQLT